MLALALLLAVQAVPQQGPVKTFGDWVAACDNVKRCEMTSLLSEDGDFEAPQLSIVREPGPAGGWTVELMPRVEAKELRLAIEGAPPASAAASWRGETFAGAETAAIVAAIVDGSAAVVTDPAGKASGRVSLTGTAAALRFIDAQQGRAATVTAAVAKGTKPARAVPAPSALPRIDFVRPAGAAVPFTPAMRRALDKSSACGSAYEGGTAEPPPAEVHALGNGKTLVLLPCGSGAYNFSTEPYILAPGRQPALARFDSPPGFTGADGGRPSLVNAGFDPKTGRLDSFSKGRGLGDCGSMEGYVWDGAMFRLAEARLMPECRGSMNWLTVWRAEAVAK